MYFAGSWNTADGLPSAPTGQLVPWYRIVGNKAKSIRNIAAAPGDQLCWDPSNKEWFIIDTTDQVTSVNGQIGLVTLDADDVGARSDSWVPSTVDVASGQWKGKHTNMTRRFGESYQGGEVFFGYKNGKGHVIVDGEFYADEGKHKVYHPGNKPTWDDVDNKPMLTGGRKNLLINGDFRIWQRGTSRSSNSGSLYLADRWKTWFSDSATMKRFASTSSSSISSKYYARFTFSGSVSLAQVIENAKQLLKGKTVTLSFWLWTSESSYRFTLGNGFTGQNDAVQYISNQTISKPSGWHKVTHTFDYVFNHESQESGICLVFSNVAAFAIAEVQLEIGSQATEFELTHIITELAACHRYYQTSYGAGIYPGHTFASASPFNQAITIVTNNSGWFLYVMAGSNVFPVVMRAIPTFTIYDHLGNPNKMSIRHGKGNYSILKGAVAAQSNKFFGFDLGMPAPQMYVFNWVADAEL